MAGSSSTSSSPHNASPSPVPSAHGSHGAARPLSILLVEDHADTADIFRRVLELDGHHVRIATTLAQARTVCRETHPEETATGPRGPGGFDVVLCDIGLPDGSGAELLPLVRSLHPGAKMIATTSYCMPDDLAQVKDAGFDGVLSKPFEFGALRALLDELQPAPRTTK